MVDRVACTGAGAKLSHALDHPQPGDTQLRITVSHSSACGRSIELLVKSHRNGPSPQQACRDLRTCEMQFEQAVFFGNLNLGSIGIWQSDGVDITRGGVSIFTRLMIIGNSELPSQESGESMAATQANLPRDKARITCSGTMKRVNWTNAAADVKLVKWRNVNLKS